MNTRRKKLPVVLEPEEAEKLLFIPNKRYITGIRNKAILALMLNMGLRVSEFVNLKPGDLNLTKRKLRVVNGKGGVEIIGLPININDLKALPPFEFQNWCVGALGGTVNSKKIGDMGIDGFTFMYRYPIQVKQSESIGRNVIDNFETALQRVKQDIGYIIAFSFGKGAYEEVARAKQRGLHIELLTVDKLLEFEEEAKQGKIL